MAYFNISNVVEKMDVNFSKIIENEKLILNIFIIINIRTYFSFYNYKIKKILEKFGITNKGEILNLYSNRFEKDIQK
jgi:hypothetical protein